ncbi:hypothetical protein BDM02DRAFT_3117610 [Thelephora ganbajun]|uniref:Uncharacterized protein n=1 Tax=Thelephora ganbajun TaxID=370292 RepID=A0ACB6ZC19_THEGA|nr:hypothetical protein BDM02DRAFT_3117610 [Thelephora ganbajun]
MRGEAVGETVILLMCPSEPVSPSDGVRDEPRQELAVFEFKQTKGEVEHGVRGDDNIVALPQILDQSRIHSGS